MSESNRELQPAAASAEPAGVLGLDIGGANLKAATATGEAASVGFALWLHPQQLAQRLVSLATGLPACQAWAVTMTGEMADVFADRAVGVRTLVEQTLQAAARLAIDDVAFYSVTGEFVSASAASGDPDAVASANWHALAQWVAGQIDSPALLIDVGGTTTDLIALEPGRVATASQSDFDRLVAHELVYLGGTRTPVCSLVHALPLGGRSVPVMREVFATTDDCALVLGLTPEDAEDRGTSDGGPRTAAAAANRLARMVGLDHRHVDLAAARRLAQSTLAAATDLLAGAVAKHPRGDCEQWILSGHTAEYFFPGLLGRGVRRRITRLSDTLGPRLSRVAPAYACAQLRQRSQQGPYSLTPHPAPLSPAQSRPALPQPASLRGDASPAESSAAEALSRPKRVFPQIITRSVSEDQTQAPAESSLTLRVMRNARLTYAEGLHPTCLAPDRIGNERRVVKLGGSLLRRPDLPRRLQQWLAEQGADCQIHLIVGGGAFIDSFRELDAVHQLDPVAMHWRCVRALRATLEIVAEWLPEAHVIDTAAAFEQHRQQRQPGVYLIAADVFYHSASGDAEVPCGWATTSDSIAALLARKLAIDQVVLLKSCPIAAPRDLAAAQAAGIIDESLRALAGDELDVELVCFIPD